MEQIRNNLIPPSLAMQVAIEEGTNDTSINTTDATEDTNSHNSLLAHELQESMQAESSELNAIMRDTYKELEAKFIGALAKGKKSNPADAVAMDTFSQDAIVVNALQDIEEKLINANAKP